ncbi:MAG: hypothetical protein HY267_01805, partial [Deltaproteobacteria bacterium]|nr:hypothetical protein [Deltaproteobacteria bacterium]
MKAQNRGGRFEERWHADILEPTRSVFILLREILPLVILLMILEQAGGAEHAACLVINSSTLSKPIYVSKCGGLPSITVRLPSACVLNGTAVEFVGSPPPTFTISGGGPKIEYKPDGPSWILGNGTGWAAVFHSGGESDSANLTITVTARDTDGHDHTMTSTVVLILLKQCDDGSEVEPGKACPDGQPTASLSSASPTDPLAPLTVSRSSVIQSAHSSENPAMSSFSGNVGASLKSVSLDFSMGRCLFGEAAGSVSIREKVPSSGLCTPACLFYDTATNTLCQVLYSGSYPRQFKMPEGLVDVITNSSIKYSLKFYASTNVGTFTNGLYLLSGVPFSTITIENLDGSGSTYNQLRITGNDLRTYDYAYGTNG